MKMHFTVVSRHGHLPCVGVMLFNNLNALQLAVGLFRFPLKPMIIAA
jgi:hypothetical protein